VLFRGWGSSGSFQPEAVSLVMALKQGALGIIDVFLFRLKFFFSKYYSNQTFLAGVLSIVFLGEGNKVYDEKQKISTYIQVASSHRDHRAHRVFIY
jgi:hypothetical protein